MSSTRSAGVGRDIVERKARSPVDLEAVQRAGSRLDEEEVHTIRQTVRNGLRPMTGLEAIYVEDIADVTAQIAQKRRLRDAAYLELGRDIVWKRLCLTGSVAEAGSEDAEARAYRLARGWFQQEQDALEILEDLGLATDHILAIVHYENAAYFHGLDLSIERLEKRRRALNEDLGGLRLRRSTEGVEDAQFV